MGASVGTSLSNAEVVELAEELVGPDAIAGLLAVV
jgi:hypothetical protein